MREIKFRAWSGKEMFYGVSIGQNGKVPSLHGDRDWPIMQYTGLKDKNGKEIYEGDALLRPNATEPEHLGWIIVFKKFGFYAELINDIYAEPNCIPLDEYFSKCDIIGNIHENPEML